MDLQRKFGRQVRVLRKRQGLTQKGLGERCGKMYASQRIGMIERGALNVTLRTITALCKGLACEPLDLFLFDDHATARPVQVANRRLGLLWNAADEHTKSRIVRIAQILCENH